MKPWWRRSLLEYSDKVIVPYCYIPGFIIITAPTLVDVLRDDNS
jgi:hypothetical protein